MIEDRTRRIFSIKKALNEVKRVEERRFIAQSSLDLGCTPAKIEEYLVLLRDSGLVKIEDGFIEWLGK